MNGNTRDRGTAFILFGFLFACYLFTFTGTIQSSDGLTMFVTTENLARRGGIDCNQLLWMGEQQASFGPDGNLYSRKGLGVTLAALPLALLARLWPALGMVGTALLLNPLLTAWSGALVFLAGRRLGLRRPTAIATALLFGLATLAWPYSQTFFSEPLTGWGTLACLVCLLRYREEGGAAPLLLAGAAWGMAYLSRSFHLITLPLFVLTLEAFILQRAGPRDGRSRPAGVLAAHLPAWVAFGLPILAAGALSLWWNLARYGAPLESGYITEVERFSGDVFFGLWGLLAGPARGLIWYSPALLLALPGGLWLWRKERIVTVLCAGLFFVYLLGYSGWFMWHGGFSWGPRFLVPAVPFLALLCGPALERLTSDRVGRPARLGTGVLVLLSLVVGWLGLIVPFGIVQDFLAATVQPLFAAETFTRPALSPLWLQWRFISAETIHLAWWRAGPSLLGFLLPLAGMLAGGYLLLADGTAGGSAQGTSRLIRRAAYGLFLTATSMVLLFQYRLPLSGGENVALASFLAAHETAGDAILDLRVIESQRWANAYPGRLPAYGPADARELAPAGEALMERLTEGYRRLWVLSAASLPEQSGWERGLRGSHYLALDRRVDDLPGGAGNGRLTLYLLAPASDAPEMPAGVDFFAPEGTGEPLLHLDSYGMTGMSRPGEALAVILRWECLSTMGTDYRVFIHLRDAAGETVAQSDTAPVNWSRPTSTWAAGERIVDRHGLFLSEGLLPGSYSLHVGFYDPADFRRLRPEPGEAEGAVFLGHVHIAPAR